MKKGLVYYTCNTLEGTSLVSACRRNLLRCAPDMELITVSKAPINFGKNFVVEGLPRSPLSIFTQIVKGLEESTADIVYMIEHDVLYHPSHFLFVPEDERAFYYNQNRWAVDPDTGKSVFYHTNVISLLVAFRDVLLEFYRKKLEFTLKNGWKSRYGYSPPRGLPKEERRKYKVRTFMGDGPNLDVRHNDAFTKKRMNKNQFRSERSCRGWTEVNSLPYWGDMSDWDRFIYGIRKNTDEFRSMKSVHVDEYRKYQTAINMENI
jgi:hypothetical protein